MVPISVLLVVCGVSALFSQDCCGERVRRIVGGRVMSRYKARTTWPFLVSLQFHGDHPFLALQGLKHLCGGMLVHAQWVLTAAHCTSALNGANMDNASYWTVKAGEYDRNMTDPYEQERDVVQIIRHPDFQLKNGEVWNITGDLALMKLRTPFQIGTGISVLGMDRRNRTLNRWTKCHAAGWGQHGVLTLDDDGSQDGNGTMVPHIIQVKIVDQEACKAAYNGTSPFIDKNVFCFGSHLAKDTCKGDSGGPLLCTYKGRSYLSGIVSLGAGCALQDYPGIYTRLGHKWWWVRRTIIDNTDANLITAQWRAL